MRPLPEIPRHPIPPPEGLQLRAQAQAACQREADGCAGALDKWFAEVDRLLRRGLEFEHAFRDSERKRESLQRELNALHVVDAALRDPWRGVPPNTPSTESTGSTPSTPEPPPTLADRRLHPFRKR